MSSSSGHVKVEDEMLEMFTYEQNKLNEPIIFTIIRLFYLCLSLFLSIRISPLKGRYSFLSLHFDPNHQILHCVQVCQCLQ